MKKKISESVDITKAKRNLGKKIKQLRESQKEPISQRKLASLVELSPSNMKYIEDGINAPTADIYNLIISKLKPGKKLHIEMDKLYTIIRGTPPPDVCDIVINNVEMNDILRIIKDKKLTAQQLESLRSLLMSFNTETVRGEN